MKKTKTASKFPNIYRIITENLSIKRFNKAWFRLLNQSKHNKYMMLILKALIIIISVILIFGIAFFAVKIYTYAGIYTKTNFQRQELRSQINFWKSIADKYEGYKDAYFRIALLEYKLRNFKTAKQYNQKALILDPNFDDAKKLEVILNKK